MWQWCSELRSLPSYERGSKHRLRVTDAQADPNTIRERVEAVARSLSIDHLLDRKPRQLSGGQQQRALGRAIARQPKVFFDEPLSNLDAQLRDDTRAELKLLHHQLVLLLSMSP